ncbi:hypothetical protein B0H19DRAFT_1264640 [Mycena capillaripes]|nr:hypothetical protein B0H19DRAFT_1264640 [Mycena capillaripes]
MSQRLSGSTAVVTLVLVYEANKPNRALAFIPHAPEPMFVFTAGGRYYTVDERGLLRFNSNFVSNDGFEREIDYGTAGIGILTQNPIYSGLDLKPLAHGVPAKEERDHNGDHRRSIREGYNHCDKQSTNSRSFSANVY